MPATERRRHPALARRASDVSGVGRTRSQASRKGKAVKRSSDAHELALIQRELAELDEECARYRRLWQRLNGARKAGRDAGDILAELGPSVLHLHVHTKGLDRLIDRLE